LLWRVSRFDSNYVYLVSSDQNAFFVLHVLLR
jgi:hypothetical protein